MRSVLSQRTLPWTTVGTWLAQAGNSILAAVQRPDSLAVIVLSTMIYSLIYLFAIGHLFLERAGFGVTMVSAPLTRLWQRTGTFQWEPIARVDVGSVSVLFSPLNASLAVLLGLLVGLNLGVAYLAWRQPKACGIGAGSGFLAAIPALLTGSACCAPVLLIVLGIQASGLLLLAIDVALPLGILLLLSSLVYVGRLGAMAQADQ